MRRRKAAKGGAVPMTTHHEKPVDNNYGGYTGGAPNNGYPAPAPAHNNEYNGQPAAYGGQPEYTNHQNEYNSSYNGQQQSYAPPPGPPAGMAMPNAHY